jgi:hypothetical protein
MFLVQKQEKDFYIDFVDELFTTTFICFNHALSIFKDKDLYDYYAFCASDAYFRNKGDLRILLDDMDENCCFISPQADKDMFFQLFEFDKNKPPTRVPLGGGVNNHLSIFTRKFMKAYDFKYIDIITYTESFYTFLCAAIKCHHLLSHKVLISHAGFTDRTGSLPLVIPLYKRDFYKILDEGVEIGLGFEAFSQDCSQYKKIALNSIRYTFLSRSNLLTMLNWWRTLNLLKMLILKNIVLNPTFKTIKTILDKLNLINIDKYMGKPNYHKHNPDCFDENGYAKTDDLYHFIKENLFLKKDELNYETIPHKIYPV